MKTDLTAYHLCMWHDKSLKRHAIVFQWSNSLYQQPKIWAVGPAGTESSLQSTFLTPLNHRKNSPPHLPRVTPSTASSPLRSIYKWQV